MNQLNLQFTARPAQPHEHRWANLQAKRQRWWAAIWRGLPVEPTGKHYRAIHCSVWLYLYLVIHVDRKTGTLHRLVATIARDMGISQLTIRLWLAKLKKHQYIETTLTGRAQKISITKWKAITSKSD